MKHDGKAISEADLRKLVSDGMSLKDIALATGWPSGYLHCTARVLGIKAVRPPPRNAVNKDELALVVAQLAAGQSIRSIASSMGILAITLTKRLERYGLPTSQVKAMRQQLQRLAP